MLYYLNVDKSYRKCSVEEWATQFESLDRHIGINLINGKYISTVWLGKDLNFFGGAPLLLETMIFDKENKGESIYCERYTTWKEAEEGHKKAVQWVLDGCEDD